MTTYEKAVKLFKARPELWDLALIEVLHHSEESFAELFDEMLDEVEPEVSICGFKYAPSHVLKAVDEIAYRQELFAYIDSYDFTEIGDYYFEEIDLANFIEQHTKSEVV